MTSVVNKKRSGGKKKQPKKIPSTVSQFILERESKLRKLPVIQADDTEFVLPLEAKGRLKNEVKEKQSTVAPSSFMDPRTVYQFMLKGYATLTANLSGVIASYIPFDPSSTGFNFSEWTDLVALFSEFRLKSFHCQFVGSINLTVSTSATSPTYYNPIAIGSNLSFSAVPTSFGQVISQADGIIWKGQNQTTDLGYTHKVHPGSLLGWSSTSSPTNTPYAGAPGCIQIYGTQTGYGPNVALVMVSGIYEFRSRS
jgi:hypothetical protein